MTHSVEVDRSPLGTLGFATAEWRSAHHNVLLEGPEASTKALLLLLEPHLRHPVLWKRRAAPLELPASEVGAVILQAVDDLSAQEQTRLLGWLHDASPRTKIVSTTAPPLFPLVACGLFDAELYYRLNVLLLQVD